MSARWSVCGSAVACSGDMYAGVPRATPIEVSLPEPELFSTALATPKSVTSAWRPERRMLSGLMSRWTMPCLCAMARASATSRMMRTASGTGSSPSRASLARSDSPSMKGMM